MKTLIGVLLLGSLLITGCTAPKPKSCADTFASGFNANPCGPKRPINTVDKSGF